MEEKISPIWSYFKGVVRIIGKNLTSKVERVGWSTVFFYRTKNRQLTQTTISLIIGNLVGFRIHIFN